MLVEAIAVGARHAEVDDVIKMVWYPNESGEDLKASRDEIGQTHFRGYG